MGLAPQRRAMKGFRPKASSPTACSVLKQKRVLVDCDTVSEEGGNEYWKISNMFVVVSIQSAEREAHDG